MSFSACGKGNNTDDDPDNQDSTHVEPKVHQAHLNYVFMSTTDQNLASVVGAVLEIRNAADEVVFSAVDVRSETDVVFDWSPDLTLLENEEYTLKVKDGGGNVMDQTTFKVNDAINQDEFAVFAPHCTFFFQLTWTLV
jgi:hypothetical protein